MQKKWLIIGVIVLLLIALLAWLFIESSKPPPGEKMLQDGRNHIPEGSKIDYKFNPPTSGDHYPSWISKGFYDTPRPDGNLVHSQEHGYIVFWYDCEKLEARSTKSETISNFEFRISNFVSNVYAQGLGMTGGSEGSPSASLDSMPKAFSDGSCDSLKNKIKDVMKKTGEHKLIAVPRIGMDYPLILTAWGRMEKLSNVDQGKVKEFIDAFRDLGPEKTNEP